MSLAASHSVCVPLCSCGEGQGKRYLCAHLPHICTLTDRASKNGSVGQCCAGTSERQADELWTDGSFVHRRIFLVAFPAPPILLIYPLAC